jgi:hypothetical protein
MAAPQSSDKDTITLDYWKSISVERRRDIENEAAIEVLSKRAWESASMSSSIFIDGAFRTACFEIEVHDLWHIYITAAKKLVPTNDQQDAFVRLILSTRERGDVLRIVGEEPPKVLRVSNGARIWSDLPFLVEDLVDEWVRHYVDMSSAQRTNLMAFVARLIAIGICNDKLAVLALSFLRDVLETPRPLSASPSLDTKNLGILSIEELINPVQQLFSYGVLKLVVLSNRSANFPSVDQQLSKIGELAREAGVDPLTGFSPSRWRFWTRRIEELCRCDAESVVESAKVSIRRMWRAEESIYGELYSKSFGERWKALGLLTYIEGGIEQIGGDQGKAGTDGF